MGTIRDTNFKVTNRGNRASSMLRNAPGMPPNPWETDEVKADPLNSGRVGVKPPITESGPPAGNPSPNPGQPGVPIPSGLESANGGSGQYQNLRAYLTANQGSGERMGQQLAAQVAGDAAQAQASTDAASADFNKQLGTWTSGQVNGTNKPGAVAPQGLSDASGYGKAFQDTQKAAVEAGALNSNAGRQAMLEQRYGGQGQYTQGMSGLDAYLAGNSAGGRRAIESAGQRYGGLRSYLTNAQNTAATAAGNAKPLGLNGVGNPESGADPGDRYGNPEGTGSHGGSSVGIGASSGPIPTGPASRADRDAAGGLMGAGKSGPNSWDPNDPYGAKPKKGSTANWLYGY